MSHRNRKKRKDHTVASNGYGWFLFFPDFLLHALVCCCRVSKEHIDSGCSMEDVRGEGLREEDEEVEEGSSGSSTRGSSVSVGVDDDEEEEWSEDEWEEPHQKLGGALPSQEVSLML